MNKKFIKGSIFKVRRDEPAVRIGTTAQGGMISFPYAARASHLHVTGVTRSGKSRFLSDLIRQDISNNHGLCLIDPHGELYEQTIDWLTRGKVVQHLRKNIHPVDFSDLETTFHYNPLHVNHPDEAYGVADDVVNAISRIFGGSNPNDTPLTTEVMTMVCVVLAQNNLPLAAAHFFLMEKHKELRDTIVANASSEWHRDLCDDISRMNGKEYRELISSTRRRFEPFIANPNVRRIFSTTENTANLKDIMDNGHVLLVNCRKTGKMIGARVLRTLGMLLTNQFFAVAFERDPKAHPRPFNLYIDEVQNFISDDIEEILSQCSKFGLYLTLSHQYPGQFKEDDQHIFKGIMAGTRMKAVFASTKAEAGIFSEELFMNDIDYQRVKKKIKAPSVIGHQITNLGNQSETAGTSETTTSGETWSEAHASGQSESQAAGVGVGVNEMMNADGEVVGLSASDLTSESGGTATIEIDISGHSVSTSTTTGTSESATTGASETFEPIIEWLATQTYTLEEQLNEMARRIAALPDRHGFFYVRGQGVVGFKTRDIPDEPDLPTARKKLLTKLVQESLYLTPTKDLKQTYLTHLKLSVLAQPPTDEEFEEQWFDSDSEK